MSAWAADEPLESAETTQQAVWRRKVEAADRDLARLKATQFDMTGEAGQIAVEVRDAQARSFLAPFAVACVSRGDGRREPSSDPPILDIDDRGLAFEELPSHSILTPI
jgi:hypothetical protein